MAITNATPRHIALGTEDLSTRRITPIHKDEIQFVPLAILNTPKGDYERHWVTGGELMALYGDAAMDPTSDYANHQSILIQKVLGAGATCVVQRVRPKVNTGTEQERDANIAGVTFYMYVKDDTVARKEYKRDATTYRVERDAIGTPQEDPAGKTIDARFVGIATKYNPDVITNPPTEETITTSSTGTWKATPIFTIPAEAHGTAYNNYGIALDANVGEYANLKFSEENKSMLYNLTVYDKSSGRKQRVKTILQDEDIDFTLKPYSVDPLTKRSIVLGDIFPKVYGNYTDPDYHLQPYTFGKVVVHDLARFEGLMASLLKEEMDADDGDINPWADYSTNDPALTPAVSVEEKYLFNWLNAKTLSNVEYEVIRPILSSDVPEAIEGIDAAKTAGFGLVTPSREIPTYLKGGEDGDYTNLEVFENNVIAELDKYMDIDSQVIPTALNKETIFIDSGFSLETKKKFGKFIGLRRDTFLLASTYVWNVDNVEQPISEAIAYGSLIKSIYKLYPESTAFGTETARAAIVMGSGYLSDGIYRFRMPMTLDYAVKLGRFAGAGNGAWKGVYEFSTQPQNIVSELIDVSPKFIPDSIKTKMWKTGLIWVENEDRVTYFYPGQQTIYTDDTSVLNSVVNMIAIGTIARYNDAAWRKFTGSTRLSPALLTLISSAKSNIPRISLSLWNPIALSKVVTGNFFLRSI